MPLTREPRNKDIYTDEVDQKGGYVAKVRDKEARKSIEQLQAEVDELASRPPAVVIDDTTPSYGSVYSSQKVEDELGALSTELSEDIDDLEDALDVLILVQNSQPTDARNKIWIKETATPVVIPDMNDIADLVSFVEDQTSRTGTEKARARANINAEKPWVKVWENASPTSIFSAQTIQLDLSGYTDVKIPFLAFGDTTGGQYRAFGEIDSQLFGNRQYMFFGRVNNRIGVRPFWPTSTGVEFGACQYNNGTNNNYGIPYRIYAR